MWKYMDQNQSQEFLLSLHLLHNQLSDKEKVKMLYSISNSIEENYNIIKIKKRNGSLRTIYQPHTTLKLIQKQILKTILNNRSVSTYAKAYHKNIGLKDNAYPHVHQKRILKLDIKDFFEHIQFIDVYNACFSLAYFPQSIGHLLTQLCTYHGYLPQGAPTSAYISNLVMKEFDEQIGEWCENKHICYTRYSDDMTFSGDFNPREVIQRVRKALYPLGLEINNQKIHVIGNGQQQNVTGLVVNQKVQTSSRYRKKVRQAIYYMKKYGLESHLSAIQYQQSPQNYLHHLYGQVQYILQINPLDQEFQSYQEYLKKIK